MSERWGVAGLGVTGSGMILVFPKNQENSGKREVVLGVGGEMEDIGNMLELFGGAVEEGDWVGLSSVLSYALIREVREERGVDLCSSQIQILSEGMEVLQYRESREVNFLVACFMIQLNYEQELFLRSAGASDLENINDLRPRDREMIYIYNRQVGIPAQIAKEVYA